MSPIVESWSETSAGKSARDENFPVGSILLPARLRLHVAAFYAFARAADDIADDPKRKADEKIEQLNRLAAAIAGAEGEPSAATALRMRASLATTGVSARHCLDLLDAFRQDAVKLRYRDWDELMAYCMRSAAPVGRYLLDLHDEDAALHARSDSLCSALQVLNHLQDCAADYKLLDRVYIPEPWLAAEGLSVAALAERGCDQALRRVLDRALDGVDCLLDAAAPLAALLNNRRLAMEAAAIQSIARRLAALLRRRDPLANRVALSRVAYAAAIAEGIWKGAAR